MQLWNVILMSVSSAGDWLHSSILHCSMVLKVHEASHEDLFAFKCVSAQVF